MKGRLWGPVVVFSCLTGSAFAQADFTGDRQYPGFRGMSGLPGSGFAVNPNGDLDFHGAMSFSTPIAYSLGKYRFVAGGSVVSNSGKFTFFHNFGKDKADGNGTGQAMLGLGLERVGNLTAGLMFLSGEADTAINFHFTPGYQKGPVRFAIGVQDIGGNGGASGEEPTNSASSTSAYIVGTWMAAEDTYVSLGTGSRRFRGLFGNASTNLSPQFKAWTEYDAYNFNFGVAWNPFGTKKTLGEELQGKKPSFQPTFMIGLLRGKYATWSINIGF